MNIADIPDSPEAAEAWLEQQEGTVEDLRPRARSRVIWSESGKTCTPFCLVYLHGFKATHQEGDPVHFQVARELGCNLLLTRMPGHGLVRERPLADLRPDDFTESALLAMELGLRLGNRVLLMGTSTGGSLSLWLAGLERYRERVCALVLYSPLIDFYGFSGPLLRSGAVRALLARIPGRNYLLRSSQPASSRESAIWYSRYALQGALALGAFISQRMTARTFGRVRQPLFAGYWPGDRVVSPSAIVKMTRKLGTDASRVDLRRYPDAGSHVICSGLLSGAVDHLREDTVAFLKPLVAGTPPPEAPQKRSLE